jgi:hypothetical protein
MRRIVSAIIVIWLLLCMTVSPYAQTIPIQPYETPSPQINPMELENKTTKAIRLGIDPDDIILVIKKKQDTVVARGVFSMLYNPPRVDEEKVIREEWRKAFGFDVWRPYYKAKAVEKRVKKVFSVKVFKLKGEPQFEKNQFTYTFKAKF